MADLTRDELDRLLASYAASGSTGWIVDVARMARASLDMVPAADVAACGASLPERTISRRARRWEAAARRWWAKLVLAEGAEQTWMGVAWEHNADRVAAEHERDTARRELGEVREAAQALVDAADTCDREASSRSSAPLVRYLNAMSRLRAALGKEQGNE